MISTVLPDWAWTRRISDLFRRPPTPVRPGHTYIVTITDEPVLVRSVGRSVDIERQDAQRRPETTVPIDDFRRAIDAEFVEHDRRRCGKCRDNMNDGDA